MIQITDAARQKIDSFVRDEVVRDPALRVELDGGPAQSPLAAKSYRISLVERDDKQRTEIAIKVEGIRVLLNLDTSNLLSGAVVDWVDDNGAGFRVGTADPRRPSTPPSTGATPKLTGPLAEKLQLLFDQQINPAIAAHGGAVELVDVDEERLQIRMTGGCQGCAASQATLRQGIERMVREAIPEIGEIVDVTDHGAGVNPYY
ncbi:MAG: NifU family protein [Longimicrobiaceae bacterium]